MDDVSSVKCSICDAIFGSEHLLKKHIETLHNKDRHYKCSACNRTFNRLYHLKRHVLIHEDSESVLKSSFHGKEVCDICGQMFAKRSSLKNHKLWAHEYGTKFCCSHCKKCFPSESLLAAHVERVHENGKKHKCPFCDEMFTKMSELSDHKKRVHPFPFKCDICGKVYRRKENLTYHTKSHFSDVEQRKAYKCSVEGCGKCFTKKNNLKTHVLNSHGGDLPYTCDECGKKFLYQSWLTVHIRKHHTPAIQRSGSVTIPEDFFDESNLMRTSGVHI